MVDWVWQQYWECYSRAIARLSLRQLIRLLLISADAGTGQSSDVPIHIRKEVLTDLGKNADVCGNGLGLFIMVTSSPTPLFLSTVFC